MRRDLFLRAAALPAGDRAAMLDEVCGGKHELRAELESLLRHYDEGNQGLSPGEFGKQVVEAILSDDGGLLPHVGPDEIRRYRIERLLDYGGMGMVYLAEQWEPRRHVALKVLHPAFASGMWRRRFALERDVLGRLKHAGIAPIYDAGVLMLRENDPRPFFSMEYVEGSTLQEWAEQEAPSIKERVRLIIAICSAVQHAHQKAVIHRDLKPANVLVTSDGQPKVLDFGLAKVLDSDSELASLHTSAGQIIGTVVYMSPEQLAGDPDAVDVRADVYSLGVMLYELLCKRLPHDVENKSIGEVAHIVTDTEPIPIGSVDRSLDRDLQLIAMKAVTKDRVHRYQSAAALAADLSRYLKSEMVLARKPTVWYRTRKLIRRHRALSAGLAIAALGLIIGTAGATWQAVLAKRAEADALNMATRSGRFSDFLEWMVFQATPLESGQKVLLVDALNRAEPEIAVRFAHDPEAEAMLRTSFGIALQTQGDLVDAEHQLRAALELRREHLGADDPDTIRSLAYLATLLQRLGRTEEADQTYSEAFSYLAEIAATEDPLAVQVFPDAMRILADFGRVLDEQGQLEEAERVLRWVLQNCREFLGPEHGTTRLAENNLASVLHQRGCLDEAETLYRGVLDYHLRTGEESNAIALLVMNNLAGVLDDLGRRDEAEATYRQMISAASEILDSTDLYLLGAQYNLAVLLESRSELDEAESLYATTLDVLRRSYGEEHAMTRSAMIGLAGVKIRAGTPADAEIVCRQLLALEQAANRHDEQVLARFHQLSIGLWRQGDYEKALSYVQYTLEGYRCAGSEVSDDVEELLGLATALQFQLGRLDMAEQSGRELLDLCRKSRGDGAVETLNAAGMLAIILRDEGALTEAVDLFSDAIAAHVGYGESDDAGLLEKVELLVQLVLAEDQLAERADELRLVLRIREQSLGADHSETIEVRNLLLRSIEELG